MRRRPKNCRSCRELFQPHPRSYRQGKSFQITCVKPACRAWRRRQAPKRWREKNPGYDESRQKKLRLWRAAHVDYWRKWRTKHPGYVQRNRQAQKRRNRENRGMIAKQNAFGWLHREKLRRIRQLNVIAKRNAFGEVAPRQIDGLCRYLDWRWRIAKRNDMDG